MTKHELSIVKALLELAEQYEYEDECEWGKRRNLEQMLKDGDLAGEIIAARALIAQAEAAE